MIRILGRPTSSNVQKVLWCGGELGIELIHEPEYGGTALSRVNLRGGYPVAR